MAGSVQGGAMPDAIVCAPKRLPRDLWVSAAAKAVEINPINHPPLQRLTSLMPEFTPTRERIPVLTTKYWHAKGVRLTVGFLEKN
jgi:hypothetical protein